KRRSPLNGGLIFVGKVFGSATGQDRQQHGRRQPSGGSTGEDQQADPDAKIQEMTRWHFDLQPVFNLQQDWSTIHVCSAPCPSQGVEIKTPGTL
ncbi:hypothetical protein, partial [Pseudomonas aeruginosa]|uniref:hypothetical protein n=1 Tax=Pseudomonas aeruginosa TaxID=287 RepID=UPI001ABC298E